MYVCSSNRSAAPKELLKSLKDTLFGYHVNISGQTHTHTENGRAKEFKFFQFNPNCKFELPRVNPVVVV